jgi:hypothetical protein
VENQGHVSSCMELCPVGMKLACGTTNRCSAPGLWQSATCCLIVVPCLPRLGYAVIAAAIVAVAAAGILYAMCTSLAGHLCALQPFCCRSKGGAAEYLPGHVYDQSVLG